MNLRSVTISNFLSFGEAYTLILEDQGLVFIEGENRDEDLATSNGAGKSLLIEAIVWCLFGKTLRGLTGDDVINRKVGKDCYVELVISHGGKSVCIIRGRKTTPSLLKSPVNRFVGKKVELHLSVEGVDVSAMGDPKETQRCIEQELGISFDVFTNTVVFGQGAKWRFSELGDVARKELFDKILGVEFLGRAHGIVKNKLKELRASVDTLTTQLDFHTTYVERHKISLLELKEEAREDRRERRAVIRQEIEELQQVESPSIEKMGQLKECISNLENLKESLNTKMLVQHEKLGAVNTERYNLAKKVEGLAEAIDNISYVDSVCKHCGSKITKATRERHLKSLKVEMKKAGDKLVHQGQELEIEKTKLEKITEEYMETKRDLKITQDNFSTLDKQQVTALVAHGRIQELKEKKKKIINVRFAKRKAELLKLLEEGMQEVEATTKYIEEIETSINEYEFWLTGFGSSGVRSHLLDHVTPILNTRANKYARMLAGGLTIEFDTQKQLKSGAMRDKFDLVVTNRHGADQYNGNSGGEKRRIDIVVARTLQSLEEDKATPCNVAFWDEVFESLDEAACEAVMKLLREEAEKRSSIFVISHLDWLKPYFHRVIRVIKENGFSRLEVMNV